MSWRSDSGRRKSSRFSQSQFSIAQTQVAAPDVAARTVAELAKATNEASELRRTYERAAGPTEQLQQLAVRVTELLDHEAECPVCRHNWVTAQGLRNAILAASAAIPPSLAELAEKSASRRKRTQASG